MAKAKARKGKMRISAVAAAAMATGATGAVGATGATGPDGTSGTAGVAAQGVVKERGERTLRRLRPLDLYERKGWITKRQSFAGDVLYWLWAIGVHGARPEGDALPPEVRTAFGPRDFGLRRLDALGRYRRALTALGKRLAWVQAVCCEELLVADVAARLGRDRRDLMPLLRHALDVLADHWEETAGGPDMG